MNYGGKGAGLLSFWPEMGPGAKQGNKRHDSSQAHYSKCDLFSQAIDRIIPVTFYSSTILTFSLSYLPVSLLSPQAMQLSLGMGQTALPVTTQTFGAGF